MTSSNMLHATGHDEIHLLNTAVDIFRHLVQDHLGEILWNSKMEWSLLASSSHFSQGESLHIGDIR